MENETPLTTDELLALLASAEVAADGTVRLPASEGTVTTTSYPLYF